MSGQALLTLFFLQCFSRFLSELRSSLHVKLLLLPIFSFESLHPSVGLLDDTTVGVSEAVALGVIDGEDDGVEEGYNVGVNDGKLDIDGKGVPSADGFDDGKVDGSSDGILDGAPDAIFDGDKEGDSDGFADGPFSHLPHVSKHVSHADFVLPKFSSRSLLHTLLITFSDFFFKNPQVLFLTSITAPPEFFTNLHANLSSESALQTQTMVGSEEGDTDGEVEGDTEGDTEGTLDGVGEDSTDGDIDGEKLGATEGRGDGIIVHLSHVTTQTSQAPRKPKPSSGVSSSHNSATLACSSSFFFANQPQLCGATPTIAPFSVLYS